MVKRFNFSGLNSRKAFWLSVIIIMFFHFGMICSARYAENDLIPFKHGKHLTLKVKPGSETIRPLQSISIESNISGKIEVLDGEGETYFAADIDRTLELIVGGALGNHLVLLSDFDGVILDKLAFAVDCRTSIDDESGRYKALLDMLYHTMINEWNREASVYRYQGKDYHVFVGWLRDHVHTLKGMKYFYPELKSGIDLYADSQRDDGMIWDNYTYSWTEDEGSYWVQRFRYGDFVRVSEEDRRLFTRIPVENDVEYLFIEGIYHTWKATGDDAWMKTMLDKALKALEYSRTDPLRWSDKFQLLKRGYTIDTWDFQNDEDAAISVGPGNVPDPMVITEDYTRFGIMFGDNTGMAASCRFLAEMLEYAGRNDEAKKIRQFGKGLQERVDQISWNGRFYRHHVPEEEGLKRDLGVDEAEQVSLSNAYSLNRNITREQAVEIIKTYRRIRQEMPESSPGEFYTIFPPFNKGYDSHGSKWNYMNGGVTSIVAGELARGAFEHGFENYGVDILNRIMDLARRTDNYLHCTYRGKMPEEPKRNFSTLDLREIANADFWGETIDGVMGWTNEGDNDLRSFPVGKQIFENIPFDIIDPANNDRKACLGISSERGYAKSAVLPVGQKAKSIYFLHTTGIHDYAGRITLIYDDGDTFADEIGPGKIQNWWYPSNPVERLQMHNLKVAWRGSNARSDRIGVCVYGLNNPYPEKTIKEIRFDAAHNGARWMMLGVTVSDHEVYFTPDIISTGIPDNWGAAAVVYALVEGLVGVKDLGVAMNHVLIAPRWPAAGTKKASATIKYEASGGYTSYDYRINENNIELDFTGNAERWDLELLIPSDREIKGVYWNDQETSFTLKTVEQSKYLVINCGGRGVHHLNIEFH
jgi:hypothetical protein